MPRLILTLGPGLAALLSATLYVLAFPPYGLAWLSFVALVPWLASFLEGSLKRSRLQSWWLCILISLLGFHWVAYVLKQFAGLPWPVAGLGLLGFSTFGQLQFVGFALFVPTVARELKSSPPLRALGWLALAATTYTALDYLLPKLFRDTLGHSWTGLDPLRMNARWAGAYGLTWISTFCNLCLAWAIVLVRTRGEPSAMPALRRAAPMLAGFAITLGLVSILGRSIGSRMEELMQAPQQSLPLAVIQANIGDLEKLAAESGVRRARKQVIQTYFELSDEVLATHPQTQAVIWPETAYPSTFRMPEMADDLELDQQVENYSRARNVAIFFGGYDRNTELRQDYNALFFLGAGAVSLKTYRKNRLLLFGEEMPFSRTFPQLRRWFPQVGNFARGDGPTAIELPTQPPTRAAPAICYEVLYSEDMITAKKAGAQWILNITNDSWFGPLAEPQLHLGLSTFRAIELGIPMVRSTNTGITAWIDPLGRIHQPSALFEKAVVPINLPLVSLPRSLVEQLRDPAGKLAVVAALAAWLSRWQRRRRMSKV